MAFYFDSVPVQYYYWKRLKREEKIDMKSLLIFLFLRTPLCLFIVFQLPLWFDTNKRAQPRGDSLAHRRTSGVLLSCIQKMEVLTARLLEKKHAESALILKSGLINRFPRLISGFFNKRYRMKISKINSDYGGFNIAEDVNGNYFQMIIT